MRRSQLERSTYLTPRTAGSVRGRDLFAGLAARPILSKPMPSAYGIPDGFDFTQYDHAEKKFSKTRTIYAAIIFGLIFIVVEISVYLSGFVVNKWGSLLALAWPYLLFGIPLLMAIYKHTGIDHAVRRWLGGYLVYFDRVLTYRTDVAAWEFTNSERGLGYWQALRGTDFEIAVALLFKRRGCDVTTTKSSGDGGIDLVLKIGGKVFWCQCKGYAKPVPVAPIREIAGVCSGGQASPILLAVNGYTKPARETANDLGVMCLDAPHLCKLARLETITSISEVARGM